MTPPDTYPGLIHGSAGATFTRVILDDPEREPTPAEGPVPHPGDGRSYVISNDGRQVPKPTEPE